MNHQKKPAPRFADICRAYLVMMWFLFGAFLGYGVFAFPDALSSSILSCLTDSSACFCFWVPVVVLCLAPLIVAVAGLWCALSCFLNQDYLNGAFWLAAFAAFYLLWWAFWYAMYGRKNKFHIP